MKKFQCFVWSCLLFVCLPAFGSDISDFEKQFKLLPRPQQIILLQAQGLSAKALRALSLKGTAVRPPLTGALANLPITTAQGAGVVVLNLATDNTVPVSGEGYVLEVKKQPGSHCCS